MATCGIWRSWWPYLPLLGAMGAVGLLVILVINGLDQHRSTVAEGIRARLNQRVGQEVDRLREQEDRRSAPAFAQRAPGGDLVVLAVVVTPKGIILPPISPAVKPTGQDAQVAARRWCATHLDWLHALPFAEGALAWTEDGWGHWPYRLLLGPDERLLLVRQVRTPAGTDERQVLILSETGLQVLADALASEFSPAILAVWLRHADKPLAFRFDLPRTVVEANTPTGELRNLLVLGVVLCLLAITAGALVLRRSRQQLIREQNFTAAVSHELKTPVAAMQALADNLAEGRVESIERQQQYHRLLSNEAARLGHLVDNVLAQTRLERGRLRLQPRPGLVNRICRDVREQFVDRDVRLDLDGLADVVPVDEDAIKRILINLLDNARKYAPGSPVTITTRSEGKDILLAVADQGPGIPDESKALVLESWQRVHGHEHQPGLGLGLSLVAALIGAHGGRLTLRDNDPHGLVIEIRLPLALDRYLLG